MADSRDMVGIEYASVLVQPGPLDVVLINYDGRIDCNGNPCWSPPSRLFTVHVDYDDPADDGAFNNIIDAIKIRYTWGVVSHIMRADLLRGVPVTLAGQRIIVSVDYPVTTLPAQGGGLPPRQPPLRIKCSLALDGTRSPVGGTPPARFTENIGTINAAAASGFIRVPEWASSAVLQTNQAAVVGMLLTQFTDTNGAVTLSAANIGKGDRDSVPIANGARFFTIGNTGAAAATGVRVIFNLGT